jgi:pimeloyl-ACP methyl ester carboxylesterase
VSARAIFCNLDSLIAARARYPHIDVPVDLAYGDLDWSRPADRERAENLLLDVKTTRLQQSGHFTAFDSPGEIARILLDNPGSGKSPG